MAHPPQLPAGKHLLLPAQAGGDSDDHADCNNRYAIQLVKRNTANSLFTDRLRFARAPNMPTCTNQLATQASAVTTYTATNLCWATQ
jgi:hypothetical protein